MEVEVFSCHAHLAAAKRASEDSGMQCYHRATLQPGGSEVVLTFEVVKVARCDSTCLPPGIDLTVGIGTGVLNSSRETLRRFWDEELYRTPATARYSSPLALYTI